MSKPVTIYDIAKAVNTSTSTVSRVLSNSGHPVRAELRNQILRMAKELRYVPNMLGRQLKTKNSLTIGVIVPTITNPFYSGVVLGIEEIARMNGYHVLLCNSHQSSALEGEYLQTLFEMQVQGLIISSISVDQTLLNSYIQRGMKVIAMDQILHQMKGRQINFDYRQGGYLATEYLIRQGHRSIAYVTAPLDRSSRIGIHDGYREALKDHGIDLREDWIQVSPPPEHPDYGEAFEFKNGQRLTRRLLEQPRRPTAIFACNDMTAIGVLHALISQGIEVPRQMSVIGFDNIDFAQMVTPPLTTIEQPKYDMGRHACHMLLNWLGRGVDYNRDEVLQPRLVERESAAAPDGPRADRAGAV